MLKVKEIFNNARTKIKESKIATSVKGFFSNIANSKIMVFTKSKIHSIGDMVKNFTNSHQNIKDSMAGDVTNRFSTKFKKFFKDKIKNIQEKANNGSKFAKFTTVLIKIVSIIATVAFAGLVIYCLKDVFVYCLMLVATCVAVALSIEFILSILSIATGCKI